MERHSARAAVLGVCGGDRRLMPHALDEGVVNTMRLFYYSDFPLKVLSEILRYTWVGLGGIAASASVL